MPPARTACLALVLAGCGEALPAPEPSPAPTRYWAPGAAPHSATIALADAHRAVVVHPDSDSVGLVDLDARALLAEIALGPTPAERGGRWEPAVAPVSVAASPARRRAYAVGRNSGELVVVDLDERVVVARARVCTEPTAVLVAPGESRVFVACAADREVLAVDAASLRVVARADVPHETSALALDDAGASLLVAHPRTGAVTRLDAATLAVRSRGAVPEAPPRGHPILAHGAPRALTDLAARPGSRELWVLHTLLATDTAQPVLDFESTAFPAVARLDVDAPDAAPLGAMLSTDSRLAGVDGALLHIVSGVRALAFTADGSRALVLGLGSETLTVVDCARGVETGFLEDLPGAMHDGLALHPDGARAWVNARNSGTLVPLAIDAAGGVRVDGAPFATRASDPMPPALRTGQWVFHTANDRYQQFPITVNHWLSCESCHGGGGTSSVTQRMAAGPRDVPDLRAGLDGFLMRTATRRNVGDFWRTINVEQGGSFHPDDYLFGPYLDALVAYVERAMPPLRAPRTDAALVARGRAVFERDDVGCARCHAGPRFTDSGAGNPSLDLAQTVTLHDVGTCARAPQYPDAPHADIARRPRDACAFDTPTLRGVARTGPWLHDGSAAALRDVLTTRNPDGLHGITSQLAPGEIDALLEFLRAL